MKFCSNPLLDWSERGGGGGSVQPWSILCANADCTLFGFIYTVFHSLIYNSVVLHDMCTLWTQYRTGQVCNFQKRLCDGIDPKLRGDDTYDNGLVFYASMYCISKTQSNGARHYWIENRHTIPFPMFYARLFLDEFLFQLRYLLFEEEKRDENGINCRSK